MTSTSPLDTDTAEPPGAPTSRLTGSATSSGVMANEPADADGLGETMADDPADADTSETEDAIVADEQTGDRGESNGGEWARVCPLDRLTPGRGRAALVDGQQIAVFRLSGDPELYAIGNRDPFSGAHVLSRGIVGDAGGVPKVASPVYKQSFDLRTGRCLDEPEVAVPAYRVRIDAGWVLVEAPPASGP